MKYIVDLRHFGIDAMSLVLVGLDTECSFSEEVYNLLVTDKMVSSELRL